MKITPLSLTQWDENPRIQLEGVPSGVEVHYSQCGCYNCLVVDTYESDGSVFANVPNTFMSRTKDIKLWLYVSDGERGKTIYDATIHINPKPKPDNYTYTETEVKRYDTLDHSIRVLADTIGSLDKLETKAKNSLVDAINELANRNACDAPGEDAITPHIGENGNWYLGDTDTGVKAAGTDGDNGGYYSPEITPNEADNSFTITFKASKSGMPAVAPVTIKLPEKSNDSTGDGGFDTDETLSLKDGILSVNTTDKVEEDNGQPITSGAVYNEFSKAVALLKTI